LGALLVAALLITTAFGGYTWWCAEALEGARRATTLLAQSTGLSNASDPPLELSLLLALESLQLSPSAEGIQHVATLTERLPQPASRLLHPGAIRQIAISPDERHIGVVSDGRDARVWRVDLARAGKSQSPVLLSHAGQVNAIAFNDGGLALTSGADGKVRIWNLDGTSISELPHPESVNGIAIHPLDLEVATAADDGVVRIWDVADPDSPRPGQADASQSGSPPGRLLDGRATARARGRRRSRVAAVPGGAGSASAA
jgi:WD40 repeat protein